MNSKYYIPLKERIGFLTLIVLVVVSHQLSGLKKYFPDFKNQNDLVKIERETNRIEVPVHIGIDHSQKEQPAKTTFDPNTATEEQLIASGMSKKAISNLIKYRSKGGLFDRPEDLLKIYAIDTSYVMGITPFLDFPIPKKEVAQEKIQASKMNRKDRIEVPKASKSKAIDLTKITSFDPNSTTGETLSLLGFSDYAIKNLIKYREKGGRIYQPTDLLKIYGVDSNLYQSIAHKILISDEREKIVVQTINKIDTPSYNNELFTSEESNDIIDLNKTTAEDLMLLRGIGPVLSKRIIEYRNKLGGYLSVNQLNEVYGISDETFEQIATKLTVSHGHRKIYFPELSFKEVLRHPYMDYEATKLVKNLSILDFEEKIITIIDNDLLDPRVIPYILKTDPNKGQIVSETESRIKDLHFSLKN